MAAKIAPKFYVDPELWRLAVEAFENAGMTHSEAVSRLLAHLVATDPAKRARLFQTSPATALSIAHNRDKGNDAKPRR